MISLTARQSELFGFIQSAIADEGIAPSFEQMAQAIGGKSVSTVFRSLAGLEERGAIRRRPNVTRGIEVVAHMADGTPLQFIPHSGHRTPHVRAAGADDRHLLPQVVGPTQSTHERN